MIFRLQGVALLHLLASHVQQSVLGLVRGSSLIVGSEAALLVAHVANNACC